MHNGLSMTEQPGGASFPRSRRKSWKSSSVPPGSSLDEITLECPDLTWNQVFCEINRMSRTGQVKLILKGRGLYEVSCAASSNTPA
jgi:hypothetical protein